MTLLSGALLLVCVVLWAGEVSMLASINKSDAAGNGLTYSFGMLFVVALWIMLAALIITVLSTHQCPAWVKLSALVLLPFSLTATFATVSVLRGPAAHTFGWLIAMPAVVPLLVMSYALWTAVPAIRTLVSPDIVHRTVWGGVFALSIIPWPVRMMAQKEHRITEAERVAAGNARVDRVKQELNGRLHALSPQTPLVEWLQFATAGNDLRDQTLQGIRELPNRQSEAEALTGDGLELMMRELRNLDLVATPTLCSHAQSFLIEHAESFRARAPQTSRYEIQGSAIERYLFAMQWLVTRKCNIADALDRYQTVAMLFPQSPDRDQFVTRLKNLRSSIATN